MTVLKQHLAAAAGVIAALVLLLGLAPDAAAQQLKIGYADAELVLVNMPEYKTNAEKVQRQARSSQQELEAMGTELQADMEKFEKQAPILSPEKLEERQLELQQRYADLQKQGATKEQELAQFEADLMNPLIERVGTAVNTVAEEKGLDIVMKSPGLLYVSDRVVDITIDVAKRLGIQVAESDTAAQAPAQ
ncbi:MAG: OmpH family outer membrane protein [Rhodothermia bacterium]|nr:OmpH family outer membrane protein [Rhodothermia bacterium]NNE35922.1 OmpH family outer membrane protein [Rhodothermales bacterium]